MRIFVTGVNGQLGYDVVKYFEQNNEVVGTDVEDLDITNEKEVQNFFVDNTFDVFVHCAAYTNVEAAEENKELCHKVNVEGTKYLKNEAEKQNALFIYFSTDYVFDGTLDKSKQYSEDDRISPLSVYGLTKEMGEQITREYKKHYIFRISWVYGKNGHNFAKTMLKLADRELLTVISDQVGSPTYTKDIAENLLQFIESNQYGTYHFTNTGYTNWADYARYVFELTGKTVKVENIETKDYKTKAERPLNSQLSQDKLVKNGFVQLPDWKDAVKRYLIEIGEL